MIDILKFQNGEIPSCKQLWRDVIDLFEKLKIKPKVFYKPYILKLTREWLCTELEIIRQYTELVIETLQEHSKIPNYKEGILIYSPGKVSKKRFVPPPEHIIGGTIIL